MVQWIVAFSVLVFAVSMFFGEGRPVVAEEIAQNSVEAVGEK